MARCRTADTEGVNSAPGFSRVGEYWLQIAKIGTTYTCFRSDDGGETFTEMFSYNDSGVEATRLILDAYTGMTEGWKFTVKSLIIE